MAFTRIASHRTAGVKANETAKPPRNNSKYLPMHYAVHRIYPQAYRKKGSKATKLF